MNTNGHEQTELPKDTRIVYSMYCMWWDSIQEAGTLLRLPHCPFCGSPLFEAESIEAFTRNLDKWNEKIPNYKLLVEWGRGKCYKNAQLLIHAFNLANPVTPVNPELFPK